MCFRPKNVDAVLDEMEKRVEKKLEDEIIPKLVGEIVIALLPRLKANNVTASRD